MLHTFILSFLSGGLYKLYDTMKNTNGFYETLPPTLQDFITMIGPSIFTYISAYNGNIPLTLLCGIIVKEYIKTPFPEISHESHKEEVYIITQLLKKFQKYFINEIKNKNKNEKIIHDPFQEFPPLVKKFLYTYGDATINSIQIRKRPVESFYEKLLALGSFGKWEESKKNANFDEIYHISLIIGFNHNSSQYYIQLDRGEIISVNQIFHTGPEYEFYNLSLPITPFSIKTFLEKGASYAGPSFYNYHIFENNCQHFVNTLLEGNNLQTPEISKFVSQHTDVLQETMPKYIMPVMNQLINVPLVLLFIITCISFSYKNFTILPIVCSIFYFLLPIITYKTLFPEIVSFPKIIASCILWIILILTLIYNLILEKKYIHTELLLFGLGYMTMSIGYMLAQFTKDVIDEYIEIGP
jgi:hypothetical protein